MQKQRQFLRLAGSSRGETCPGDSWSDPKAVLVMDYFIIHRGKATKRVCDRFANGWSCEPSTYAPQLSRIELPWKYLRRKVTSKNLFDLVAVLVAAVFRRIERQPAITLSVIGCTD